MFFQVKKCSYLFMLLDVENTDPKQQDTKEN